jgi:hypothetical protein
MAGRSSSARMWRQGVVYVSMAGEEEIQESGGSSVCEHGRKQSYKECGAVVYVSMEGEWSYRCWRAVLYVSMADGRPTKCRAAVCEHNRQKYCKECGGGICEA